MNWAPGIFCFLPSRSIHRNNETKKISIWISSDTLQKSKLFFCDSVLKYRAGKTFLPLRSFFGDKIHIKVSCEFMLC